MESIKTALEPLSTLTALTRLNLSSCMDDFPLPEELSGLPGWWRWGFSTWT